MRIDLDGTRKVVRKALDLGINFFDTADVYGNFGGSETFLGQILGEQRKQIVLATKFGLPMSPEIKRKNGSRRYIMAAVEGSLKRLKTDWIDLYQIHFADPLTPIEETLRALDDLVRQGKVRYIGCSNFAAWQVVEAQWTARHLNLNAFATCQEEYSLLVRNIEREMLPAMRAYRFGLLPYFPLASGMLTGKYKHGAEPAADTRFAEWKGLGDRYNTPRNWEIVTKLEEFAKRRGHTLLDIAIGWLLASPIVSSVIAGATKPEQLEQNTAAANIRLSADDLAEIDRITG